MIIDIVLVGLVILVAIIALVLVYFSWKKEKKNLKQKVNAIVEEAKKNVEPSVLIDSD
jgi:hypothetical protein